MNRLRECLFIRFFRPFLPASRHIHINIFKMSKAFLNKKFKKNIQKKHKKREKLSLLSDELPALDDGTRAADILLSACDITVEVQLCQLLLNEIIIETLLLLPKRAAARFATAWAVAILARVTILHASRIKYVVCYKVICSQLSESCKCFSRFAFASNHSFHPFLPLKRHSKILILISIPNMQKRFRNKKQKKYLKNPQKKEPSLLQNLKIFQLPNRIYTSFQSIRLHVRDC